MGIIYDVGTYWGRITKQRVSPAKTGTMQLVVSFVVRGKVNLSDPQGDLLPIPGEYERTVFRAITEKAMPWVIQDLDRLGWYGSDWRDFDEQSSGFVSIIGTEHAFRCDHEPHNVTKQMMEKWSVAGGGLSLKPLEDADAKRLQALFGKHLRARTKPDTKPEPVPQPKPSSPEQPDPDPRTGAKLRQLAAVDPMAGVVPPDDIPF